MRNVEISRTTKETEIRVSLCPAGSSAVEIDTGIGFFDHMLTALAVHAGIGLSVSCKGDLGVDCHHTIEDVGISLGLAFRDALGDRSGVARYGSACIPMDEALGFSALDIGGRAYLVFSCTFAHEKIGEMDTQMVEEFFRAFAYNAGFTLHLSCLAGQNDHHKAEALFKAFAHALKAALAPAEGTLSTKGVLA